MYITLVLYVNPWNVIFNLLIKEEWWWSRFIGRMIFSLKIIFFFENLNKISFPFYRSLCFSKWQKVHSDFRTYMKLLEKVVNMFNTLITTLILANTFSSRKILPSTGFILIDMGFSNSLTFSQLAHSWQTILAQILVL